MTPSLLAVNNNNNNNNKFTISRMICVDRRTQKKILSSRWELDSSPSRDQGSKFKFEFGSTCATRCKFLGALPKF